MKRLLLCVGLFTGVSANSQTTIFQDNFESGAGNWTLNGGTGANQWLANNVYAGFSGFINNTPNQPASFTGGVNSTYLHITNNSICGAGICNANFDTGSATNQSATKNTPIVTTGYTNVTLDFWYVCAGSAGVSYGIVEYSTDGGTVWTAASGQYSGVLTWTNAVITLPAFDNQASLNFRFRWLNGAAGADPAFSVDEVKVTGTQGANAALTTGAITTTVFCSDNSALVSVPFTVTGTVNAGNVYTAQLSDGSGSFASPTAIGSLSSASTGTLSISATIPAGLPAGNAYRIRVDASDPATVGTDNGTNITIAAPPTVTVTSVPSNGVICPGGSAALSAAGGIAFVWSPAGSLNNSTSQNVIASPGGTQPYTVIGTDANGCSGSAVFTVVVQSCLGLEEETFGDFELYPNPVNEVLNINFGELKDVQTISILDLAGRKVLSNPVTSSTLDASMLESGKYFLMIEHAAGVSVKAFVKQ